MDRDNNFKRETNPRATANFLSLVTFFYNIKHFAKGFTKGLEIKDIYEILPDCRSKIVGGNAEQEWYKEAKKRKTPSICRLLWILYGKAYLIIGFFQFVATILLTTWSPKAVSKLISYFTPGQNKLTKEDAIFYGCLAIGLNLVNAIVRFNFRLLLQLIVVRARAAVTTILYRKSLKMTSESLSHVTTGKVVTIVTKDMDIIETFVFHAHTMWTALVQTVVTCFLIYQHIGIASFSGITFLLLILLLQVIIAKMTYKYKLRCSKKSDERLDLIREVLAASKVIKMYTWENFFEQKIHEARRKEIKELHKMYYNNIWITVIGSISSKTALFILLMTYVWMGNNISAETAFYLLSCFQDLESSLNSDIPSGFSHVVQMLAVVQRIESVLEAEEIPIKEKLIESKDPKIVFKEVDVEIHKNRVLDNVTITLTKDLNVVVGHTGSGKTTFLKSILKEYQTSGDLEISGTISYASQEPWLFPSTIRNNILFGENYNKQRYHKVLQICCLEFDLDSLIKGDNTIVGESGTNLSKGQQARINLARALYRNSDIYLLDDCLASLDGHVSDDIFKEGICTFLKNKLCIFVTNNLDYVQKADRAIVVDSGSVKFNNDLKNVQLGLPFDSVETLNEHNKTKIEEEKNRSIYHESKKSRQVALVASGSVKYNNKLKNIQPALSTDGAETRNESNKLVEVEEISKNRNVYDESKNSGRVPFKYYVSYVKYGGVVVFTLVVALVVSTHFASSYSDKLFSEWVTLEQNVTNYKESNQTHTPEYEKTYKERTDELNLYIIVVIICIILSPVKSFTFFYFARMASNNIHKVMVRRVLNSTMKFFDSHFIGNVLNRFNKDYQTLDYTLAFTIMDCLTMIFTASGGIAVISTVSYIFLLESLVLIVALCAVKEFCQSAGRNTERLHVITRAPINGHLNSTLEGLTTIRASNAQEIVCREFDKHQDLSSSAFLMMVTNFISLSFYLKIVGLVFTAVVIFQFLATDIGRSVGDVGLVMTQSFVITNVISNGILMVADWENLMVSVERILEYTELEEEEKGGKNFIGWPITGSVNFQNVFLTYGNKQMLRDINFVVNPKDKIGIVGRTGAGKSSLISSLFRLYPTTGKIAIDGIDIRDVSLACLRSNISVIPQDPYLFSGTIRENLDPLKQCSDEQIWKILKELHLDNLIQDLNAVVDKGSNFSAGQKQWLCLVRVILRRNKIVILDEATANVDHQTDIFMQEIIQKYFAECTVLVVAHKTEPIRNCHKIMVLDRGQIKEFGEVVRS